MTGRTVAIAIVLAILVLVIGSSRARAAPTLRCDNLSTADLTIDGVLDDWQGKPLVRIGTAGGVMELRCSWDGTALALAVRIEDDRIVRVRRGRAHEDRVTIKVGTGGRPLVATIKPGNAIAKAVIVKPARAAIADALQPKGFAVEARLPGAIIPGLSASTPALALDVIFHDSDQATGGANTDLVYNARVELSDRKDLLVEFLKTVRLARTDVRLDTLAELDPDRRGKERVVAGGTVIGILTDKFAYVTLPAARPADVLKTELLPLGNRGHQVIAATVRQAGNGGTRELLLLFTVWSGQLEPLATIEIKKQVGARTLEASWKIVKTARGPELWVEPKPAIGFTRDTWNEEPARDVDAIVLPWDARRGGVAYSVAGKSIARRDLPKPRRKI